MDKDTISTYGMILITVMLISIFIAMATPIGRAVVSDLETKLNILANNTGVMDVEAQTDNYGTVVVYYRYENSMENFRVYKTSVRLQEYCNIEYPDIEGYEPIVENASAPTRIQVTKNMTHIIVEYRPRTYSVSYVLNGGSWGSGTGSTRVLEYEYGSVYQLPTAVKRSGYRFVGWFEDSGLGGVATSAIEADDYGDKVFYAKYTIK
jgi:uncharacterized repeat protein (TIGR02543 family)